MNKSIWSRTVSLIVAFTLATSGAMAQPVAKPSPRILVLEGGTLIDGTGRAPVTDAVIVIEGTRIKAVGKKGQVQVPANATVIRVDGRTILPGLMDIMVSYEDWYPPMLLHYGVTTIAGSWSPPRRQQYGVTAVAGSGEITWMLEQREALNSGKIKGPRLFVKGPSVWESDIIQPNGFSPARPYRSFIPTMEETRALVRSQVAAGVDIISTNEGLFDEHLLAIVEVADAAGRPVLGETQNILRAAQHGMKVGTRMDMVARGLIDPDENMPPRFYPHRTGPVEPTQIAPESVMNPKQFPPLIDYLIKQRVYLDPTLVVAFSQSTSRGQQYVKEAETLAKDPDLGFVPAAAKRWWTRLDDPRDEFGAAYNNVAVFLREFSQAGGKVIVGTDAGPTNAVVPGLGVHREMQMLNDVGIPAMKVIQGATLWTAEALKKDKDLGSIEPGKLADIVVIEGNPLADISVTKNVRMVIKDGEVMDTKYDPKWVNPMLGPSSPRIDPPSSISSLHPESVPQGTAAVTLEVHGARFTPNSVVHFDGAGLPTKFVDSTSLTAVLAARLSQRHPGTYQVYVVTPGLHGSVSNIEHFLVNLK